MGNKRPTVVVTDGDHIMRISILHVLPSAVHRLCGWCLDKNAGSNVKEGEFQIRFARLMYNFYTEDEFEEKWRALVHEFNLHDNELMRSTYEKRHSWAETFLRGFFPGMRTTQHCESMNSFLQVFLDCKHLLRNFVCQIDSAIAKIRFRETQDDFNTKHASPQLPHTHVLLPYFHQLSQTVTRNVYNLFKNEMDDHSSYFVTSEEYIIHHREIVLSKFMSGEVRHRVRYYSTQNHLSCTCMLLESDGIPCSHIFSHKTPKPTSCPRLAYFASMAQGCQGRYKSPHDSASLGPRRHHGGD